LSSVSEGLSVAAPRSDRTWGRVLALAAGIVFLHWHTLVLLVTRWYTEGDYTYGFLVPPISLFLLWSRRAALLEVTLSASWWGLVPIFAALVLQLAGASANIGYFQGLSLVILIVGIVILLGGGGLFRATAFPILFLFIMIPLPGFVQDQIAFPLQLLASGIAADTLELLGIPVARDGNVFQLASITLQVNEACSGIRSLFGLLAMGILLGYLITPHTWKRIVLALSTIPIDIAANILRVTGTGLLCEYVNPEFGKGFYHLFGGWIVFLLAMGVLFLEASLLSPVAAPRTADEKPDPQRREDSSP